MITFHNTSIRTKLSVAFGTALALVIALGAFGLYQLQSIHHLAGESQDLWLPRLELLDTMKRSMGEQKILATRRLQTTNFHHLDSIADGMRAAEQTLGDAEQKYEQSLQHPGEVDPEDEAQPLAEFRSSWSEYQAALRAAFQRLDAGEIGAAQAEFDAATTPYERAAAKLDELIRLSKEESAEAAMRAKSVYWLALHLTLAAIALTALFALAAIMWVSNNISAPILRVSDAMRKLTAGDDSVAVLDDPARKDEIGVLEAAVTGYRDALVRSRQSAAETELERERLQAAVSNMAIGLTMFDANQRLVVCNRRYSEIYGLPPELTKPGTSFVSVLRARIATGNITIDDPEKYIERVLDIVKQRKPTPSLVELKDGRVLNIIHQPLPGGGWVTTHEDVTERRRVEERIHHMARHDALTDLPNRILFRERVEEALKQTSRGENIAVLCLDLDYFKGVNDTLGHPIGDGLLKEVADRLLGSVREFDVVARFGGDEFAVAQIGVDEPEGATALARRIIEAVSVPYTIDGHQVVIGVSVGIAVAPSDGSNADQLLKNADLALYRAKTDGRGTYRFFEPEMDARMQARRALELDLRKALAEGQFGLVYQPVVDLRTNAVTSFEALLRWHHPQRGLVSPAEFVPLAEEIGLIIPLGEWVLRQACMAAISWPRDIHVAVNLSPVQFRNKRLLETVITALAVSKLPASRLELEVTEGVLLEDHEATISLLHQLRSLGVRIAMDDFGTGYSSLSYLRSFPFDKIKIDRSFISKISEDSSLAIVRAVTGLSASLGIPTTAEGVETKEQLDRVRAEGCTEVQGFLFSKAIPATEVPTILKQLGGRSEAAA